MTRGGITSSAIRRHELTRACTALPLSSSDALVGSKCRFATQGYTAQTLRPATAVGDWLDVGIFATLIGTEQRDDRFSELIHAVSAFKTHELHRVVQSLQVILQAEHEAFPSLGVPVHANAFEDSPDGRPSKVGDVNCRLFPPAQACRSTRDTPDAPPRLASLLAAFPALACAARHCAHRGAPLHRRHSADPLPVPACRMDETAPLVNQKLRMGRVATGLVAGSRSVARRH